MTEPLRVKQPGEAGMPLAAAAARSFPAGLDLVSLVLALIGLGISAYLSWAHFTYTPIICTADLSCDTVNRSAYAYFPPNWGIPVSYLGLLAYAGLLGLVVGRWRSTRQPALRGARGGLTSRLDIALFGATLAGWIFSAYLTAMELFVIHAVCWWCVGSATVITLLFGISVYRVWTNEA